MASPAKNANLYESFKNAFIGIKTTIKRERNIKIHLTISLLIFMMALLLGVNQIEWLILLMCVGIVIALELINTAIEDVVNLAANMEYHLLAKQSKDAAAGAVLVASMMSFAIGLIIFLPKIWDTVMSLIH